MIDRVRLENWKKHEDSSYNFKDGCNIIVGPMGAGKSSILQAISFGLFNTFTELKSSDLKVLDLNIYFLDHSVQKPIEKRLVK